MKTTTALLAASLALGLASAAQAQDFQPKAAGVKMLNVRVTAVDPEAGDPITTLSGVATGLTAEVNADVMPTIGLSYFFTDNIAVEVIAGTTKHTVKAQGPGTDVKVKETWVVPPVVALQYHFAPAGKVSPYVGAGVNYMLFYSGSDKNGFNLDIDVCFVIALHAGLDIATVCPFFPHLPLISISFSTYAPHPATRL